MKVIPEVQLARFEKCPKDKKVREPKAQHAHRDEQHIPDLPGPSRQESSDNAWPIRDAHVRDVGRISAAPEPTRHNTEPTTKGAY